MHDNKNNLSLIELNQSKAIYAFMCLCTCDTSHTYAAYVAKAIEQTNMVFHRIRCNENATIRRNCVRLFPACQIRISCADCWRYPCAVRTLYTVQSTRYTYTMTRTHIDVFTFAPNENAEPNGIRKFEIKDSNADD